MNKKYTVIVNTVVETDNMDKWSKYKSGQQTKIDFDSKELAKKFVADIYPEYYGGDIGGEPGYCCHYTYGGYPEGIDIWIKEEDLK